MAEQPEEVKKLVTIASDLEFTAALRTKAIDQLGGMRTYEAFLALLSLASDEKLIKQERELAIKRATEILKASK